MLVTHKGGTEAFDAVVLAVHSDTARALRGEDITEAEDEVLGAIPYNENTVILHTGTRQPPSTYSVPLFNTALWQHVLDVLCS